MTIPDTVPALSVVIPTRGRPMLLETLRSLLAVRHAERLKVLVVGTIEDSAVQSGVETMAQLPWIDHIDVQYDTGDSSRKKNRGAEEATTELVAFLDDDVIVPVDWVERITAPFADPNVGLVSGPGRVPDDLPLMGRLAGLALASRASGYVADRYRDTDLSAVPTNWSGIIGCNMVYRKEVLDCIGGFDPGFWPGEEMLASYRAEQSGCGLLFVPRASVDHYPRQSMGKFWKQIFGYGATRIRLVRSGVQLESTTMIPAIWVASLVVLGLLSFWVTWARWLLLLDVGAYVLCDVLLTLDMVRQTKKVKDLLLVFVIPVMHLSYGMASWREVFRPGTDLSEPIP